MAHCTNTDNWVTTLGLQYMLLKRGLTVTTANSNDWALAESKGSLGMQHDLYLIYQGLFYVEIHKFAVSRLERLLGCIVAMLRPDLQSPYGVCNVRVVSTSYLRISAQGTGRS